MPQEEIDRINDERKKRDPNAKEYRVPQAVEADSGVITAVIERAEGTFYEVSVEREGAPDAVRVVAESQCG